MVRAGILHRVNIVPAIMELSAVLLWIVLSLLAQGLTSQKGNVVLFVLLIVQPSGALLVLIQFGQKENVVVRKHVSHKNVISPVLEVSDMMIKAASSVSVWCVPRSLASCHRAIIPLYFQELVVQVVQLIVLGLCAPLLRTVTSGIHHKTNVVPFVWFPRLVLEWFVPF